MTPSSPTSSMTSSATLTKSGTLGTAPAPRPAQPGEPSATGAPALGSPSGRAAGRPVSLWVLAVGGALAAGLYAALFEKMRFGPPLVMLALGGMTLALAGAALWRMIDPLSRAASDLATVRGGRRPRELEREKQLVLKAIKEIELDYQMRKIAERDYREMIERYRARAIRLMGEIEAGDDYRTLIERELAIRLKLGSPAAGAASTKGLAKEEVAAEANAPVTASPVTDAARPVCEGCGATNDDDAKFCKKCGAKLA